jgi:hypothetical protein
MHLFKSASGICAGGMAAIAASDDLVTVPTDRDDAWDLSTVPDCPFS